MRYKYCKMHQERPKKLPEGCQYQVASGKWVKEEWPPHQWGGLLRRWPIPDEKTSKGVVYEYYTRENSSNRPSTLPKGCQVESAFVSDGDKWYRETKSPSSWGGLRRRWPKPSADKPKPTSKPKVMAVPKLHVYVRKDKVTAIVSQIKDLLKQLE